MTREALIEDERKDSPGVNFEKEVLSILTVTRSEAFIKTIDNAYLFSAAIRSVFPKLQLDT